MIISTMHQPHNKDVQHLSYDRLSTLCGRDCGNFIFVVRARTDQFEPGRGVCQRCVEKHQSVIDTNEPPVTVAA